MLPKFLKRWFSREPQELEPNPEPDRNNVLRPGKMLCGRGYVPEHMDVPVVVPATEADLAERDAEDAAMAAAEPAQQPLIDVDFVVNIPTELQAAEARGVELDKGHDEVTARVDEKVSTLKQMLDSGALSRPSDKAHEAAQSLKAFLDAQPETDTAASDADAHPWIPLSAKDLVTDEQKSVYRSTRMRRTRIQAELGEASAYALRVVAEVEKRKIGTAAEIARVGQARYDEATRLLRATPMTEAEQFEYDVRYSLLQLEGMHNEDAKFQATASVLWRRWHGA